MNSLNSVLLEGTVRDCRDVGNKFTFLLENKRYYRADESAVEINLFRCESLKAIVDYVPADLNEKRVRLVGRVKMDWRDPRVIFVAEHLELIKR